MGSQPAKNRVDSKKTTRVDMTTTSSDATENNIVEENSEVDQIGKSTFEEIEELCDDGMIIKVILILDEGCGSPLLLKKYQNQNRALKEYLKKRDEIIIFEKKTHRIPLEFLKDFQMLVKYPFCLRNLRIKDDKEFILYFLRESGDNCDVIFRSLAPELKCDSSFIDKAVQANARCYLFLDESDSDEDYKHNQNTNHSKLDLLNRLVRLNPKVLPYLRKSINDLDQGVVREAIKKDLSILYTFSSNRDMILWACELNPHAIMYSHLIDDQEIILKAISKDKTTLQYASADIIERVLIRKELVEYSQEDIKSLVLSGVRTKPYLFKYLSDEDKHDKEFVIQLLQKETAIVENIPDSLKESREFRMEWVKHDANAFYSCRDMELRNQRQFLLNALPKYKFSLSSAPPHLKDDKEFVIECLEYDPHQLSEVSARLRDDEEVVSSALEGFQYASNRLKDDKEFIMKHIENYPGMCTSISQRLRKDKDIALKCANAKGAQYIINEFLNDEEFLLDLVERNARIISSIPHTPELVRKCIERNGFCLSFLESDNLIKEDFTELAALSGYLSDKHTSSNRSYIGRKKKLKSTTTFEDRSIVDHWIEKRLYTVFDGLYISSSSPLFVRGDFITRHDSN